MPPSHPFETPIPLGPSIFGGTDGPTVCIFSAQDPAACPLPETGYVYECTEIAVTTTRWNFDGGTEGQRAVLKAAFSLLQQNMDLVEWSLCLAFDIAVPFNLRDLIANPHSIKLRFSNDVSFEHWWSAYVAGESTDTGGSGVSLCGACSLDGDQIAYACPWEISFCTDARYIQRWEGWCCATGQERLAMAIGAAALVYHELLHVTGVQAGHTERCRVEGEEDESCDRLYMAENTLEWALFTRFPIATLPECVDGGVSGSNLGRVPDNLFMAPCPEGLGADCGGSCP
jgi:hypothetical protein